MYKLRENDWELRIPSEPDFAATRKYYVLLQSHKKDVKNPVEQSLADD